MNEGERRHSQILKRHSRVQSISKSISAGGPSRLGHSRVSGRIGTAAATTRFDSQLLRSFFFGSAAASLCWLLDRLGKSQLTSAYRQQILIWFLHFFSAQFSSNLSHPPGKPIPKAHRTASHIPSIGFVALLRLCVCPGFAFSFAFSFCWLCLCFDSRRPPPSPSASAVLLPPFHLPIPAQSRIAFPSSSFIFSSSSGCLFTANWPLPDTAVQQQRNGGGWRQKNGGMGRGSKPANQQRKAALIWWPRRSKLCEIPKTEIPKTTIPKTVTPFCHLLIFRQPTYLPTYHPLIFQLIFQLPTISPSSINSAGSRGDAFFIPSQHPNSPNRACRRAPPSGTPAPTAAAGNDDASLNNRQLLHALLTVPSWLLFFNISMNGPPIPRRFFR